MNRLFTWTLVAASISIAWTVTYPNICKADPGIMTPLGETSVTSGVVFCGTYNDCKSEFLSGANKQSLAWDGAILDSVPLKGRGNEGLKIDYAFFPSQEKTGTKKLAILTSGIHGLEGFTGSAVQGLFMNELLPEASRLNIDVLVIHGINAHGMVNYRRTTANRVDLNRNWYVADEFPKDMDDSLYDSFNDLFNPHGRAKFGNVDFTKYLMTSLVPNLGSVRNGVLTKAGGQGQFRFPDGISYGGQAYEPHRDGIVSILNRFVPGYSEVLEMDLHTGLGRRQMQLLPNPPYNEAIEKQRKEIFEVEGRTIEQTGGSDFYASFGDFSDFICQYSEAKFSIKECTGMLLEFGTLSQPSWVQRGTWGMFKDYINQAFTLYSLTRENQAYHYGAASIEEGKLIRSNWANLFNPKDESWRAMIADESRLLIPKFLERFSNR